MAHEAVVHPHSELLNLAHYHRGVINRKREDDNNEAIGLDCMSAIIALSFAVEAIINVVGEKKVKGWKERAPYLDKVRTLSEVVGLKYDAATKPFSFLEILKALRDQLAHGKPIHRKSDNSNRDDLLRDLSSPWDEYANPAFVNEAADAVDAFLRILLELSEIHPADILTEGSGVFAES